MTPDCIIIIGPTGVGKTDFSYTIADKLCSKYNLSANDVVIINGDMGQLYYPISIGTAKPDISLSPYKHELFGIIKEPTNYTAHEYRHEVEKLVKSCLESGKVPIIVGGTGFYIKSLFYSSPASKVDIITKDRSDKTSQELWEELKEIDSERAQEININDRYRVERALDIWESTGQKPSSFKEQYNPFINNWVLYYLNSPREIILNRIETRTNIMLNSGWIPEVENLNENWRKFVAKKNIIGYPEILDYLNNKYDIKKVEEKINLGTIQYVKKQKTFFKMLLNNLKLQDNKNTDKIIEIEATSNNINKVVSYI